MRLPLLFLFQSVQKATVLGEQIACFLRILEWDQLKYRFDRNQFTQLLDVTMKKIIASVSLLAAMLGGLQAANAAEIVGNAKAAENKVAMCIGCHGIPGYKATFPEVYQVPKIGGQSAKYIESALKAYQKGDRKHPSMRGIAGSLTEQDIADLAAYYAQQK